MAWSVRQSTRQPRVFISYSRADGEDFAKKLRTDLEAESIPLWQDRIGMEGGRDWWQQIVEALNMVEFMVLVMTPAAMQSPVVRKEWRYARQQGVCVYPVKGAPKLDFANLPRWMRDAHFYDLNYEWPKFVKDLDTRCQVPRVPFMVKDLPIDFVPRPNKFEELITRLLDEQREEPIAIRAALRGTGGYGKTTMAIALCLDERIQQAFSDGILWVKLGENITLDKLVGEVEDLIYILSNERPGFTGLDATTDRLTKLLADRDILLVIDDVWNEAHLQPFLQGGKRCARLITTRDDTVLPPDTQRISVDAMQQGEAVQLLSAGLDGIVCSASDNEALRKLTARLGEWPLLLKLANGVLREEVGQFHQALTDALVYVNEALDECGLTVFDAVDAQERNQAVAKTLGVSFGLLGADEIARYKELAIFPEDVDIPLETLQKLWRATGGLSKVIKTEMLCKRLHRLSLLLHFDPVKRTIRLHDILRTYLQSEFGREELAALNGQLLDAYKIKRWADLPHDEPYLWDRLANHLIDAGRGDELVATVKDLRYLAAKTHIRSASAVETDLSMAERQVPADASLHLLRRSVARMSHLLNRCGTLQDAALVLHSRLSHLPELSDVCITLEQDLPRPFLTSWHAFTDLSHAALIRTLQGHKDWVRGCAVSPDGNWIVSASYDQTLKVWDAQIGSERLTLRGHIAGVNGCVVSPSGDFIVSASDDQTLKVWDARTGDVRLTLMGHTGGVYAVSQLGNYIVSASDDGTLKVWDARTGDVRLTLMSHTDVVNACAVSPLGDYIVSASSDETLKVWDARTGDVRLTLMGHTGGVYACAVSPLGDYIVSASSDETLKVWDVGTGDIRLNLTGHKDGVYGCAVSPDGNWIVSASYDQTLKVWDVGTGDIRLNLTGHKDGVYGCAVSPDGNWIVSASYDQTLKVWDAQAEAESLTLMGHKGRVNGCAVSPLGNYIVSASDDKTLKVWDAQTGTERHVLEGHTNGVYGCAVSPDGNWIVSASYDKTLKIWDAQTGDIHLNLTGHTSRVNGCAVSPDGNWVVSASDDKTLKVWDAQTGTERHVLEGHKDWVYGCAVSPDGNWVVSASHDKTLKVWDAQQGVELYTLKGHTSEVWGCAVSPDGNWVVSASYDKTLKVWDAQTRILRLTLTGHTGGVYGCAVSPDGEYIVSASADKTLRVWNAQTGACLTTLLVDGELGACAFCPDGTHLVAGGNDGVYFLQLIQ